MRSPTQWRARHIRDGRCIWADGLGECDILVASAEYLDLLNAQPFDLNGLSDEGENDMLGVYYRGGTQKTNFYLGLSNTTLTDASTLASMTEVSGTSYARKTIAASAVGFPTFSGDTITMAQQTFTAGAGGWTAATYLFLGTVSSGTAGLMTNYKALSTSRTLAVGDSLVVDYNCTLG